MIFPPGRTRLPRSVMLSVALVLSAWSCSVWAVSENQTKITSASEEALWWGDFAEVERQNAHFIHLGHTEPDGSSLHGEFRDGLQHVFGNTVKNAEPFLNEMDILTLQWAAENPKSPMAHILHAQALVAHAWSYRGDGYARDVPPEAWKLFHSYLRRAVDYLKNHADVAFTDSGAHHLMLGIGKGLGWDDEQLAAIAREGLTRNPDDHGIHWAMTISRLPKWGGNAKVLDNYIKEATEQTRAKYGTGMYARLYSMAADSQYNHRLFEDSFVDWKKMKQSYEDLLARYPNNQRRNRYAYMACLAKDKTTLLKLFGEIGTNIEIDKWGINPERNLESCRRWANEL